ncbi:FecR family protein [Halomonadaceae bacterium KBTZ08]
MKASPFITRYGLFLCLAVLLIPLPLSAQDEGSEPVARVVVATGEVTARAPDADKRALKRRSAVHQGETVVTGSDSRTQLRFEDGAVIALASNSRLVIERYRFQEQDKADHAVVRLLTGGLRTLTGEVAETQPDNYEVETPLASIGVRGTDYQLALRNETLAVAVWAGRAIVSNEAGTLPLGRNANYRYATVTARGLPPSGQLQPPASLTPGDGMVEAAPSGDATEDDGTNDKASGFETSDTLQDEQERVLEERTHSDDETSWLPETFTQTTLAASAALGENVQIRNHLFAEVSNQLTPEQTQYVVKAPGGRFLSLEGAGLERFQQDIGGYGINWGAWNGQPDLLLHEDEQDEAGTPTEPLGQPLFLASAPTLSLSQIQSRRSTGTRIEFTGVSAAIGDMRDENAGFPVTDLSDASISFGNSHMTLNPDTGNLTGLLEVLKGGGDWRWSADLQGQLGETASLEVQNPEYNNTPASTGEARGLVVIDESENALGFLNNFHFQTQDDSASATGILLLEER